MKKAILNFGSLALMALLTLSTGIMAQPVPGAGGNPGGGVPPVGGGAPIDGGVYILMAFALVYGISRWIAIHKQKMAQN